MTRLSRWRSRCRARARRVAVGPTLRAGAGGPARDQGRRGALERRVARVLRFARRGARGDSDTARTAPPVHARPSRLAPVDSLAASRGWTCFRDTTLVASGAHARWRRIAICQTAVARIREFRAEVGVARGAAVSRR